MLCLIVRHTPPLRGTPLREGMARQRFLDNTLTIYVMRQPIPSRRGVAEGRGVSHRQTGRNRGVSHRQTIKLCLVSHRQTDRNLDVSHRQNNQVVFSVVPSNRQKSGHSAPAVEKGAVICLFLGCFYALTFCISVDNSVFALFCACLCRFCVCRRVSRSFCGLFSGSVVTFLKFFSCFKLLQIRCCAALLCFRAKIFFGSLENGCIFALAFASGRKKSNSYNEEFDPGSG